MKKIFLIMLAAATGITGCKKDIQKNYEPQGEEPSAPGNCTGNTWTYAGTYSFSSIVPDFYSKAPLIYNNKAYIFAPGQVKIFDGTSWTTKFSATPVLTPPPTYPDYEYYWGMTIGDKAYLSFASDGEARLYEYNFLANTWVKKVNAGGGSSATFTIGSKGYVVGGYSFGGGSSNISEYDPATDTWTYKGKMLPLGLDIHGHTGFSINGKGYILNGVRGNGMGTGGYSNALNQYDAATNTWTTKAAFPGVARMGTAVFVIGGNAYAGGGYNGGGYLNDFYKYNPVANSWTSIANMSGNNTWVTTNGFTLNSKGYITYLFSQYSGSGSLYKYTPSSCNGGGSSQ